jgi:predicted helicase
LSFKNYSLISTRQLAEDNFYHIFISNIISDQCFISNKTKEGCQVFPLYLYHDNTTQQTTDENNGPTVNFNMDIVANIEKSMHAYYRGGELNYPKDATVEVGTFSAEDVLDYIYAVLHSPSYREKYKEFLKIDFPRVPYPKDSDVFFQLVELGNQLRHIHLLESPKVNKYITQYPVDGDNKVGKLKYEDTKVYINETQYFDKVPLVAWEFYIGGYKPAQKWLKDRKDRTLEFEDILHYQKIIVALTETDRLMKKIDKIEIE